MSPRDALKLAQRLHEGQKDKAGLPYWEHPARVQARLRSMRWVPAHVLEAAVLHDVLEDCGVDGEALLREGVSPRALGLVRILTRQPGESYPLYLQAVRKSKWGLLIKLADIGDNTDPIRLAMLDEALRTRLLEQYAKALGILLAGPAQPLGTSGTAPPPRSA